jgi:predicted transcriptional regulator
MATTSLKLPDELKVRVQTLATAQGISTHAFLVEAIERQARAAEVRAKFVADALKAERQMKRTGKGYRLDDVFSYLKARAEGKRHPRPAMTQWRK